MALLTDFYKLIFVVTHGKDENDADLHVKSILSRLIRHNGGPYTKFMYLSDFYEKMDLPDEKRENISDMVNINSKEDAEELFTEISMNAKITKKNKYHVIPETIQSVIWLFVPGLTRPDPDYGVCLYGYNSRPIMSEKELEKNISLYQQKYNDKVFVAFIVATY